MSGAHKHPTDFYVKKSVQFLQKDFIVVGKERVPAFVAWPVIMFLAGVVVAVAFLASRSGMLESSQAATAIEQKLEKSATSKIQAAKKKKDKILAIAQKQGFVVPDGALTQYHLFINRAAAELKAGHFTEAERFAVESAASIDYIAAQKAIQSLKKIIQKKSLVAEQTSSLLAFLEDIENAFALGNYRMVNRLVEDANRSIDSSETKKLLASAEKLKKKMLSAAKESGVAVSPELLAKYENAVAQAKDAFEDEDYLSSRLFALQAYGMVVGDIDISLPNLNPVGGEFSEGVLVSLSTDEQSAVVYYTTDGSIPANTSSYYTGPIAIFETTTIKARAFVGDGESAVQEAIFTLPEGMHLPILPDDEPPEPNPEPSGEGPVSFVPYVQNGYIFSGSMPVSLYTENTSLDIYYTTDGRTPDMTSGTKYIAPIVLNRTSVVKAKAYDAGEPVEGMSHAVYMEASSEVASRNNRWVPGFHQKFFGGNKFNIIAVNLLDGNPLTKTDVEQQMFNDPETSLNAWYRTVSFGNMWASGNVYGPYNADIDAQQILIDETGKGATFSAACNTLGDLSKQAVLDEAIIDGFEETSGVETVVFLNVRNCLGELGVSYNYFFGQVPVGSRVGDNGVGLYGNLVHELHDGASHTHSGGLDCGAKAIDKIANCTESDIADPFSVQGSIWEAYNVIAMIREIMNWLPPERIKTITEDGTYTLYTTSRKELPDYAGVLAYRIKTSKTGPSAFYDIEYNQPVGADARLSGYPGFTRGINIRMSSIPTIGTALLDLSPETKSPAGCTPSLQGIGACPFLDAALSDGKSFIDDINGVKITQISHDAQKAVIQVEFTQIEPTPFDIPELPPLTDELPPLNGDLVRTYPDLAVQTLTVDKLIAKPKEKLEATARVFNRSGLVSVGKSFPMRLHPYHDPYENPPMFDTVSDIKDVQVNLYDPEYEMERDKEVVISFKAPDEPGWRTVYAIVDNGDPGMVAEADNSIESNLRAWRYYVLDPALAIGKRVRTTREVNLYGGPYSNVIGNQTEGKKGAVITTSVHFQSGTVWIYVNFDDGKKGFVFVDFLTAE